MSITGGEREKERERRKEHETS